MSAHQPAANTRCLRSQADASTTHTDLDNPPTIRPPAKRARDSTTMAPPFKKARTAATPKYLCLTCDTERTSRQFPDYNPSAECEHLIHTCKGCLKSWVEVQVDGGEFVRKTGVGIEVAEGEENGEQHEKTQKDGDAEKLREGEVPKGLLFGVKCPHPGCEGVMRNINVKIAGTRKAHKKFIELERKFIGDATPGWRWCMASGCSAGQVVVIPPPKPEIAEEPKALPTKKPKKGGRKKKETIPIHEDPDPVPQDDANISTCHACGHETCISCDRPYHMGETCAQYQLRTKNHLVEEDAALNRIRTSTKACPNCKKRIEKNGGCPNMWCTQCNTNFCWNCESATDRGYCKCHPMPRAMLEALRRPQIPQGGGLAPGLPAEMDLALIDAEFDDPDL